MLRFSRNFASSSIKSNFAKAQLVGRVGNFEFKESVNGVPYATYSLAVSKGPKDQQTTNWFKLSVFDKNQLERLEKTLRVGNLLYVEANLQNQKFEDPETQKTSIRTNFVQRNFEVISWGKKQEGGEGEVEVEVEESN
ncbi:unnamed protein product [Candida verbasci]|uniref:Uncharacterized protein n=1 Tax=Candida verbasci TaxID=1227364 RepID=A0A9W4XGG8_9ASCO|nr:unnamed protein product [Candida verbasci]